MKVSIVWSLRDRKVACPAADRQGSNFESCVWKTVSSQSSHHPQEVLLAQFSLYVHKGGLKPDSFHLHVERHQTRSQQTRGVEPMLFQCWASAVGGGPTLKQDWFNPSCSLATYTQRALEITIIKGWLMLKGENRTPEALCWHAAQHKWLTTGNLFRLRLVKKGAELVY